LISSTELKPSNDCLLIFVDDTGHERLAGNQQFYGLGGLCIMSNVYVNVLVPAWRKLREMINGDHDAPLHASEFSTKASAEGMNAMSRFFATHVFHRFATVVTDKTSYPSDLILMQPVFEMVKKQLIQLAAQTPFRSIALIFESSERADPFIQQYFGQLDIEEGGRRIAVDHCLMTKRAKEPGLEVADFIANAAGSMARRFREGESGVTQRFKSVFHCVPKHRVRFMLIDSVTREVSNEVVFGHELR